MFLILWVTDTHIGEIVNHEYRKEQKRAFSDDERMFYSVIGKKTVFQLRWTKKTLAWLEKLRIEAKKPDQHGNFNKMRFIVYEAREFQFNFPNDVKEVGEAMALSDKKGAQFEFNLRFLYIIYTSEYNLEASLDVHYMCTNIICVLS